MFLLVIVLGENLYDDGFFQRMSIFISFLVYSLGPFCQHLDLERRFFYTSASLRDVPLGKALLGVITLLATFRNAVLL